MQDFNTILFNLNMNLALRIGREEEIVNKVGSMIGMSRRSVMRRLKGEYKFSVAEIFTICNELGIPIEGLGQNDPASVSTLRMYKFPDSLSFDLDQPHIQKTYTTMENAVQCDDSTFTCICNRLPEIFYTGYAKLTQLLLTKVNYFLDPVLDTTFYKTVGEKWELFEEKNKRYVDIINSFRDLTILWGPHIMDNVVSDVIFFRDIDMITPKEAAMIKEELTDLVWKIDSMCLDPSASGYKNFVFAVSPIDMNFHSNLITSSNGNQFVYFLYHLAFAYTENETEIKLQKTITDCLMKGATIISGSNHGERNRFIKEQLRTIDRI